MKCRVLSVLLESEFSRLKCKLWIRACVLVCFQQQTFPCAHVRFAGRTPWLWMFTFLKSNTRGCIRSAPTTRRSSWVSLNRKGAAGGPWYTEESQAPPPVQDPQGHPELPSDVMGSQDATGKVWNRVTSLGIPGHPKGLTCGSGSVECSESSDFEVSILLPGC